MPARRAPFEWNEYTEMCQSGRMCPLAKGVGVKASWVRIPSSPPTTVSTTCVVIKNLVPTRGSL